jgi:hypothetical protein
LVEALRRDSALFRQTWEAQTVLDREGGVRSFHHPKKGPVRFTQHTFSPSERPDYKLVILTPA